LVTKVEIWAKEYSVVPIGNSWGPVKCIGNTIENLVGTPKSPENSQFLPPSKEIRKLGPPGCILSHLIG
jgi:hypothetical protein